MPVMIGEVLIPIELEPARRPTAGPAARRPLPAVPADTAALRLSLSPRDSALVTDQELELVAAGLATAGEVVRFKRRMVHSTQGRSRT